MGGNRVVASMVEAVGTQGVAGSRGRGAADAATSTRGLSAFLTSQQSGVAGRFGGGSGAEGCPAKRTRLYPDKGVGSIGKEAGPKGHGNPARRRPNRVRSRTGTQRRCNFEDAAFTLGYTYKVSSAGMRSNKCAHRAVGESLWQAEESRGKGCGDLTWGWVKIPHHEHTATTHRCSHATGKTLCRHNIRMPRRVQEHPFSATEIELATAFIHNKWRRSPGAPGRQDAPPPFDIAPRGTTDDARRFIFRVRAILLAAGLLAADQQVETPAALVPFITHAKEITAAIHARKVGAKMHEAEIGVAAMVLTVWEGWTAPQAAGLEAARVVYRSEHTAKAALEEDKYRKRDLAFLTESLTLGDIVFAYYATQEVAKLLLRAAEMFGLAHSAVIQNCVTATAIMDLWVKLAMCPTVDGRRPTDAEVVARLVAITTLEEDKAVPTALPVKVDDGVVQLPQPDGTYLAWHDTPGEWFTPSRVADWQCDAFPCVPFTYQRGARRYPLTLYGLCTLVERHTRWGNRPAVGDMPHPRRGMPVEDLERCAVGWERTAQYWRAVVSHLQAEAGDMLVEAFCTGDTDTERRARAVRGETLKMANCLLDRVVTARDAAATCHRFIHEMARPRVRTVAIGGTLFGLPDTLTLVDRSDGRKPAATKAEAPSIVIEYWRPSVQPSPKSAYNSADVLHYVTPVVGDLPASEMPEPTTVHCGPDAPSPWVRSRPPPLAYGGTAAPQRAEVTGKRGRAAAALDPEGAGSGFDDSGDDGVLAGWPPGRPPHGEDGLHATPRSPPPVSRLQSAAVDGSAGTTSRLLAIFTAAAACAPPSEGAFETQAAEREEGIDAAAGGATLARASPIDSTT